jgi:DNA-binding SARP family transcriptional activator
VVKGWCGSWLVRTLNVFWVETLATGTGAMSTVDDVGPVTFRLLGPVDVLVDGRRLDTGPPQRRAVLAALLVDAARPVPTDVLIERVWGEDPPTGVRAAVHTQVTRIRRVLREVDAAGAPPRVAHRTGSYVLQIDPHCVDLHRFRALTAVARGEGCDDAERAALLTRALDLWHGPALANVPGAWAARMRDSLALERLDAAVHWADAAQRLGGSVDLIPRVHALLAEYPLAEPLAAVLMRALAVAGRGAEALAGYATIRARLAEELGADPGPHLRELHAAILRGTVTPLPMEVTEVPGASDGRRPKQGTASPRTPRTAARPADRPTPAQLPQAPAPFVGRRSELEQLDACRVDAGAGPVVAITGTAGIGKTALALHWAQRAVDRFPDGQLYVGLRGFDPAGRAMTTAEAVRDLLDALRVPADQIPAGLDAQAGLYRSLLAGRRMLVVLDDARDAEQVRPLLPGTATALTLVTSRDQLTALVALAGARPLTMDLLSRSDATRLLADRLGAARVEAEPIAVRAVTAACARLPLALAIVAARAQQTGFTLADLAADLQDAGERLDALDGGDASTRIRAVFDTSYSALTPPAARLFRLLGLHPGADVSIAAAASVAGLPTPRTRRLLSELTRANLLSEPRPGRYTSHDLLRVYADDLTRRHDPPDARHAALHRLIDHYTHTAYGAAVTINPHRGAIRIPLAAAVAATHVVPWPDVEAATGWLTTERQTLLSAARVAADTGFDTHAWQLAWSLDTFLHWRGHPADRLAVWRTALRAATRIGDPAAQAHAHRLIALTLTLAGSPPDTLTHHYRQALDLYARAGDAAGQAFTHMNMAQLVLHSHPDEALAHVTHALRLFRAADNRHGQALALNAIGWCHILLGHPERALPRCTESLRLHEQLGDPMGQANTWDSIGLAHHHAGRHRAAVDCYERSLVFARAVGDDQVEVETVVRLGDAHRAGGDTDAAHAVWRQALPILVRLDHPEADRIRTALDTTAEASPP